MSLATSVLNLEGCVLLLIISTSHLPERFIASLKSYSFALTAD